MYIIYTSSGTSSVLQAQNNHRVGIPSHRHADSWHDLEQPLQSSHASPAAPLFSIVALSRCVRLRIFLPSFRSQYPSFQMVFTTMKLEINELNGESWHGAVWCDLYLWRKNRPWLFMEDLLHDIGFRSYIEHYVGSNADDWYESVNRPYLREGRDDDRLLNAFNRRPLVRGSNAAALQECSSCELEMPGICYPKARRGREAVEMCHGCRVSEIVLDQTIGGIVGSMPMVEIFTFECIEYNIAFDSDFWPYVQVPLDTKCNTVCPYLLNNRKCPLGEQCSLRTAYVASVPA